MIAALVFVALVASAQAYPGRDPLEETLSIQYGNHNQLGNPTTCIIGKVFEIKGAFDKTQDLAKKLLALIPPLQKSIAACKGSDDWFDCNLQAIRDTWEGSAKTRQDLSKEGGQILKAVQDVLSCFQEKKVQQANGGIHIRTLPRRIEQ